MVHGSDWKDQSLRNGYEPFLYGLSGDDQLFEKRIHWHYRTMEPKD
jgi:hypothetical protein